MDDLANSLTGTARLEAYRFTPASYTYLNGNSKRGLKVIGAVMGLSLGMPIFLLAGSIIIWASSTATNWA